MDQATTGGFLHFHLTTFEDESSTSAMRLATLEEHVRALKSTPRSAWKMGLDLRYVDRGIRIFQFYFRYSLQMEWIPSFRFICGVLGFGGLLRSRSQDLSDWRKGVFEKHCAACWSGSEEERREEDTDFQIPVSLGTEKGSRSTVPAVVCSLNPAPSSIEHSRVSQWSPKAKKSVLGFQMFSSLAQGLPNPKTTSNISPFNEPTTRAQEKRPQKC